MTQGCFSGRTMNEIFNFKDEFSWKRLKLSDERTLKFTTSQWCESRWIFLLYRLLLAVYWIIGPVIAFIHNSKINTNPVYRGPAVVKPWSNLTSWCFIILEVDFLFSLACCIVSIFRMYRNRTLPNEEAGGTSENITEHERNSEMVDSVLPWYCKFSWLLGSINSSNGVLVTIIYFAILFDHTKTVGVFDLHLHGLNTVFIVVDNVISARPCRLLHFIYPLIFALIYLIFSIIFWSLDHKNNVNYKVILDWNHPGPTIGCIVGISLLLILIHIGFFFMYRFKILIHKKLQSTFFPELET